MKRAIVVGTGAGGAMAARELAGKFDVTVLESGPEFRSFSRSLGTVERLRHSGLFVDPRVVRLMFPAMRVSKTSERMALVRGLATGGTTTIATGNALRSDEALKQIGIDLDQEFAELRAELPISSAHERRWRPVTRELYAACKQLGFNPTVTPKFVDYSRCARCGRCVLGCTRGAKWDSRELLLQAVARGACVHTRSQVERVILADGGRSPGTAAGVIVRRGNRRTVMPADLVVLAAGGLGTPAILKNSGLPVEDRLFVDPVLCVAAPMAGCHLDAEVPMPFFVQSEGCIISPYFDYLSFFFEPSWRHRRQDIVSLMIKLADSEVGTVDGRCRVNKILTERDRSRLVGAVESCKRILEHSGVNRESMFLGMLNAGHPGGTVPLSGKERDGLHADGLPPNLYVADASLLPHSLGKPPMLTIMALSKRIAKHCAERLA